MDFKFDFLSFLASERNPLFDHLGRDDDFSFAACVAINLSRSRSRVRNEIIYSVTSVEREKEFDCWFFAHWFWDSRKQFWLIIVVSAVRVALKLVVDDWKALFPFHSNKTTIHQSVRKNTIARHTFYKLMNFINSLVYCLSFSRATFPRSIITKFSKAYHTQNMNSHFIFSEEWKEIFQIIMGNILLGSVSLSRFVCLLHCLRFAPIPNLVLNQNYFVDSKCHLKFVFHHAMCAFLDWNCPYSSQCCFNGLAFEWLNESKGNGEEIFKTFLDTNGSLNWFL